MSSSTSGRKNHRRTEFHDRMVAFAEIIRETVKMLDDKSFCWVEPLMNPDEVAKSPKT